MNNGKIVQIRSLSFAYPTGKSALEDFSLEIERGEKIGVIGANGAGKSTLLLHLNGILAGKGEISVGGLKVEKKNFKTIRRMVGLVFQNPDDQLFCPTVGEDAAFGPRNLELSEDEVARRVKTSLSSVGMAGFERRSAVHLSVGEKRRAAIATVLAMDAELIALDEPTSNLDPKGRREIIQLLKDLGRTQIVVTHDLGLVRDLCDRVVLLKQGRKAAEGKPEAILSDESLLESCGL